MANTTFSGPIRAGDIRETTGTTLGTDVANVGQVVLAQSYRFTQAGLASSANTPIVIPANSQVVEITVYVDAAFTGAASTFGVGTSASATFFTAAGAVAGGTIGIVSVTPGTDATRTDNFVDVGTSDIRIAVTPANTGTGTGTITVRYLQNTNLL
jgi:hypothetical protein